ncbi:MAG: sigma-54 dependent transcriptional regulator [Bdellovibrionota bacterium]
MKRRKVLVVDDDEVARKLLKEILETDGYTVQLASSGEEAIAASKEAFFPIVVSDIRMLDLDGLDVLKHFRAHESRSVVILMTAFGSMETAVEAIKEGAFDYLSKPFKLDDFKAIFRKAVKQAEMLQAPRTQPATYELGEMKVIIGSSPKMLEIFKTLARAAMSQAAVLLIGESGTGKELIAKAIHDNSPRRNRKFVAVNCGALTDTLLESELFGHVKGAFTGAHENRKGLFEEADGGTLFLDEIGDISAQMQVKLLRVLQDGELRPVGSNEVRKADVRIIAATHRNLSRLVSEGRFREDLYYRLKVVSLEIPPLRERKEDIPELVNHFLAKYSAKNEKRVSHFTNEALRALIAYPWPGNVRELENAVERAVALTNTAQIDIDDLPVEIQKPGALREHRATGTVSSLEDLEKQHIINTLQQVQYNKSRAAEVLGIDRATLYRKAQKYGIDLRERVDG